MTKCSRGQWVQCRYRSLLSLHRHHPLGCTNQRVGLINRPREPAVEEFVFLTPQNYLYAVLGATTQQHTHTHGCGANGHNSGSECQNPRQLDRQTRQSMFNANRRLSAVQGTGRAHPDPRSATPVSLWQRSSARGLQQTSGGVRLTHSQ